MRVGRRSHDQNRPRARRIKVRRKHQNRPTYSCPWVAALSGVVLKILTDGKPNLQCFASLDLLACDANSFNGTRRKDKGPQQTG